jgi:hypothetical protein
MRFFARVVLIVLIGGMVPQPSAVAGAGAVDLQAPWSHRVADISAAGGLNVAVLLFAPTANDVGAAYQGIQNEIIRLTK